MIFQDQQKTIQAASTVMLHEDLLRRKKMKLPALDKAGQLQYVNKWKTENELYLNTEFGFKDGPQFTFLTGVLFATSSSKLLVPNGAHSSFGKYTLFSAYATTANGNMSPLAFGLIFGNEDTNNWSKLWSIVKNQNIIKTLGGGKGSTPLTA